MKPGPPDTDFFIGLLVGPLLLWILFLCSTVLRAAFIRMARDKDESVGARILMVVFGVLFYGALPLGIIIGLADSLPMLVGALVGGIAVWLWFRGIGTKNVP